ncbi:hypothetical protein BH09ACT7_BH09ACT7_23400 [soil metagenome]
MTARIDRYAPGEHVRVIARIPGDSRKGQTGQVDRTYADCGDMMHVVRFADRQTAHYYVDELKSTRAGTEPATQEQDN